MSTKRTCLAPRKVGLDEVCGKPHASRFGDCPRWTDACHRHHKSDAAKLARKESGKQGGRPPLTAPREGVRRPDLDDPGVLTPDDVDFDPVGTLDALGLLAERQRRVLFAWLELKDIEAVSRKLSMDPEVIKNWMEDDKAFTNAQMLMEAFSPERLRDYLSIGATIGAKRLVAMASKTTNAELLLKIERLLLQYHSKMVDKDLSAEIAELREQVETLQDEHRKQTEHAL